MADMKMKITLEIKKAPEERQSKDINGKPMKTLAQKPAMEKIVDKVVGTLEVAGLPGGTYKKEMMDIDEPRVVRHLLEEFIFAFPGIIGE